MNILFVNYGGLTSNSLNHIDVFAGELTRRGHACLIAISDSKEDITKSDTADQGIASYRSVLKGHAHFPDNKGANIIHAWTPRENVRAFCIEYISKCAPRARLLIHLEDNEQLLMERFTGKSSDILAGLSAPELASTLPPQLAHPHHYRQFLAGAHGITYITERLREFIAPGQPSHLLRPGVPEAFFQGKKDSHSPPILPLLPEKTKLIVFTGSTTFANLEDIRTLLEAVWLINEHGVPCKLVRTGITPERFARMLKPLTQDLVIDLGFIDKQKLIHLLHQADVLVQPGAADAFNEYRLPSKIPEFLASRRPTIIPRANIGHQIKNESDALLLNTDSAIEIADKCLKIFNDTELSTKLALGAREFALKYFSPSLNTADLLHFYEEIIAKNAPPRVQSTNSTKPWLRTLISRLPGRICSKKARKPEPFIQDEYTRWLNLYNTSTSRRSAKLRDQIATLANDRKPLLSVIMPVYNPQMSWLENAINSVTSQSYDRWELCIADDASTAPHVRKILAAKAAGDPRIKVVHRTKNGNISAALNSALELATGVFTVPLDHDDELHPDALAEIALAISGNPEASLIYSDRDKIDEQDRHFSAYHKPDWDPDLLLGQNYLCHLSAYQTKRLKDMGGYRLGFEGSQDWDLALRFTEGLTSLNIMHIQRVLYHWRAVRGSTSYNIDEKEYAHQAARRALTEHLSKSGAKAQVLPVPGRHWRIKYDLPEPVPHVTLILPVLTSGAHWIEYCNRIIEKSEYANFNILVGLCDGIDKQLDSKTTGNARIKVLPCLGAETYIEAANQLSTQATGDILVFIHPGIEPACAGWLQELAAQVSRAEVGCAAGTVLNSHGEIVHTGLIIEHSPAHGRFTIVPTFAGADPGVEVYFNRERLVQNYSALSIDGLSIRRSDFIQLNGFGTDFASPEAAAIDLCFRIKQSGRCVIQTPFSQFTQTTPQGFTFPQEDRIALYELWGNKFAQDRAYNPNLALYGGGFTLAFPPRNRVEIQHQ